MPWLTLKLRAASGVGVTDDATFFDAFTHQQGVKKSFHYLITMGSQIGDLGGKVGGRGSQ